MSDLWIAATANEDQERLDTVTGAACMATAGHLGFVLEALTDNEYEDRLSVVSGAIESAVSRLTNGDPGLFPIVHSAVLDGFRSNFRTMQDHRAEQRCHDVARLRAQAARQEGRVKGITPLVKVETAKTADVWKSWDVMQRGTGTVAEQSKGFASKEEAQAQADKLNKEHGTNDYVVSGNGSDAPKTAAVDAPTTCDECGRRSDSPVNPHTDGCSKRAGNNPVDWSKHATIENVWVTKLAYGVDAEVGLVDGTYHWGTYTPADVAIAEGVAGSLEAAQHCASTSVTAVVGPFCPECGRNDHLPSDDDSAECGYCGNIYDWKQGITADEADKIKSRYASKKTGSIDDLPSLPCFGCGTDIANEDPEWGFMQFCPTCLPNAGHVNQSAENAAANDSYNQQQPVAPAAGAPVVARKVVVNLDALNEKTAGTPPWLKGKGDDKGGDDKDAKPTPDKSPTDPDPTAPAPKDDDAPPAANDPTATKDDPNAQAAPKTDDQQNNSDPTTMDVGATSSMGFTMGDGGTGQIEVTFIREEDGVYFFNGPTGEFGVGQQNGVWQDSDGNTFQFGAAPATNPATQAVPDADDTTDDPEQDKVPDPDAPAATDPPVAKDPSSDDDDDKSKKDNPFAKKDK